jgi:hypothetical protein
MRIPFAELLKLVRNVLSVIGVGTIIGFLRWLATRRRENFDDKILQLLESSHNQQPRTAAGIYNDCRKTIFYDVPLWVIIPFNGAGWPVWKHRLKVIPYQLERSSRDFRRGNSHQYYATYNP